MSDKFLAELGIAGLAGAAALFLCGHLGLALFCFGIAMLYISASALG